MIRSNNENFIEIYLKNILEYYNQRKTMKGGEGALGEVSSKLVEVLPYLELSLWPLRPLSHVIKSGLKGPPSADQLLPEVSEEWTTNVIMTY